MADSFVYHRSYIKNVPEEKKAEFREYIENYGFDGIEPTLSGLEYAFWVTIKERIDADQASYNKRLEYQRQYRAKQKEKKSNETFETVSNISNVPLHSEYEFKSDSEFKSEYEFEYESKQKTNSLSLPQENYSEEIYKLWKDAKLPVEKDLFQFQCGGFKQALTHLNGIHSDDVIQACKNYIKELKKSSSYITNQYRFERFVSIPSFKDFLPEFYRSKNFQKIGNGNNPVIEADKIEPWEKVGMTSKEYYHVQTVEDLLREKEEEERLKAEQTAVNQ